MQQRVLAQGIEAGASAAAMLPNLSIELAVEPFGVGAVPRLSFGGSNLASAD